MNYLELRKILLATALTFQAGPGWRLRETGEGLAIYTALERSVTRTTPTLHIYTTANLPRGWKGLMANLYLWGAVCAKIAILRCISICCAGYNYIINTATDM